MDAIGEIRTATYKLRYKGYRVDIVTTDDHYEAWLYRENESFKSFMMAIQIDRISYRKFLSLIELNAEEYIKGYTRDIKILESPRINSDIDGQTEEPELDEDDDLPFPLTENDIPKSDEPLVSIYPL